ncbi:MAG: dTMP kinase [Bdellovibrionales bacterium RIFOXYD1_FULL_53_11]|nr:MAG: dTMP kinase [Bdellovibrionales bacterium RIFOXYD1_FULL_53_11]
MFITFEGTEGAGKSTLIRAVGQALGIPKSRIIITREPGGSRVSESIRSVILNEQMDPWTELFLYEAARAEHMAKTVLPALKSGKTVLCDRFTDSTLAYQAHARGLPWAEVVKLNAAATRGIKPDFTVFMDVDPALGLRRAREHNRFEREGVKFQQKVRRGFLKSMRLDPDRWIRIKAFSGTPDEMAARILSAINKKIDGQGRKKHS